MKKIMLRSAPLPMPKPVLPLERLRQIARDLDRAITSGNWSLVAQAAALLAPVLQEEETRRGGEGERGRPGDARHETNRDIAEIQALLHDCERRITTAMAQTGDELRLLRQSKRRVGLLAVVRQRDAAVPRRLDTNR